MHLMDLAPHATDDSIYLPGRTGAANEDHFHVFYITGNPGCIAYYHAFLTLWQEKVLSAREGISLSVYGESLPNFVGEGLEGPVLRLREMIVHVREALVIYARSQQKNSGTAQPTKIVISGHSLGTYIGLEVLRWWQEQAPDSEARKAIDMVGYLGLWCTVTWINKSPSGALAKPFLSIPGFLQTFCTAAEWLISPLPSSILLPLVKSFTRFPDDAARVTTSFLKSKKGIRQALYMGRDELNEILEDQWPDEVWGSATRAAEKGPKLVFHFGAKDHWVANEVRDELIKLRGRSGSHDMWKPVMETDQNGIPHAFCIHHSSLSASIATEHLLTILEAHDE